MTAKFINLMGVEKLTRSTFDDFKVINTNGIENGCDLAITLSRDEKSGSGVINLSVGDQESAELKGAGRFTDNEMNGAYGVKGFIGSQLDFNNVNGLFSQDVDVVAEEQSEDVNEPLVWVACEYFSLANGIKNKMMILPLDEGFLVALIEGVISFPMEEGADDLILARHIGNRDANEMTFMTSSRGNIQGLPESDNYTQSFLTVTIERKISNIITRKSQRNGNNDKGLSTNVKVSKHGTVLLDGGKRLTAQRIAEEEELKRKKEQEALREAQAIKAQEAAEIRLEELAKNAPQMAVRQKAASALQSKGKRNPMAQAFLQSQLANN